MSVTAALLVVRHAQTRANQVGRYLTEDDQLSALGIRQAELLRAALTEFAISHVVHSGSKRVIQTLDAIGPAVATAVVREDDRLREGSTGDWTGLPGTKRSREAVRRGVPVWKVRPPGGESWVDIDSRLEEFEHESVRRFTGACLLLLGSGRTNSLILRRLCDTSWEAYDPRQMLHTGISSLSSVRDSSLQLDQNVDHLPDDLRTR